MEISVTDAKHKLLDLVRRAEAGEEITLTRWGHRVVRLVPVAGRAAASSKRVAMEAIYAEAKAMPLSDADVASSQDYLYGRHGRLPQC
jgi:prevent-host-death family protein